MKRDDKKQWIAIFILLMFGGSTIAIAISSVMPSNAEDKLIFDEPLSPLDEATFFKQNMVVVRVYYDEPSETINTLASLINTLNSKMMLERINLNQYPEIYDSIKDNFDTIENPMILIRGSTEIYLNGEQDEADLLEKICSVYFQEIDECY
ncbi:MAG: hypothetical protein KJ697_03690 [Nanoarchaeota archaeon]|nr:hypothetical protein [Nanoarchaeota archaeon]MBU4124486.1 hypothetical protein [Nanoarchaeota archaeon]